MLQQIVRYLRTPGTMSGLEGLDQGPQPTSYQDQVERQTHAGLFYLGYDLQRSTFGKATPSLLIISLLEAALGYGNEMGTCVCLAWGGGGQEWVLEILNISISLASFA